MKILLVKLSSLGDVVHTLPVVQDIRAALPQAQIDWVVEKSFAPLLQPLVKPGGGLRRVIGCEIRRWREAPLRALVSGQWGAFKTDLQAEAYDAVIDLQGLAKSALVAKLARLTPGGKRFALANQTEGSSYEAPTRWVADVAIRVAPHTHAVQRGRELAAQALGYLYDEAPDFGIKLPAAQSIRALDAPESIASSELQGEPQSELDGGLDADARPRQIAFVHGTSRADKEWPVEHWIALGQRFNAAGFEVVLPHGSVAEYSTSHTIARSLDYLAGDAIPGAQVLPVLALDALTQQLAGCAGVIGVDSGISHIAVALGLPHVQIYNVDTAWRTGPLAARLDAAHGQPSARQFSVFATPFPSVDAVWQAWLDCEVEAAGMQDVPTPNFAGRTSQPAIALEAASPSADA